MLTQSRLKELIHYDADTGVFTRNGKVAGTIRSDGYRKICIDGQQFYAHRVAWLYVHGVLPTYIDHIDRDPSNNKIANLRVVSRSENQHNRVKSRNNTSGYKGVTYFKRTGRWRAQIWAGNVNRYIGYFDTAEEASAAYQNAAMIFHPTRPKV
jgi:hypothetical protein